jgi:type I restriction enzyme R subunit
VIDVSCANKEKNAFGEFLSVPVTVLTSKSVDDDVNSIFLATYPAMDKVYQRLDPGFSI